MKTCDWWDRGLETMSLLFAGFTLSSELCPEGSILMNGSNPAALLSIFVINLPLVDTQSEAFIRRGGARHEGSVGIFSSTSELFSRSG